MVLLLQVKCICLFLDYLALLLPSVPHWPFDQILCAGHWEEVKLGSAWDFICFKKIFSDAGFIVKILIRLLVN